MNPFSRRNLVGSEPQIEAVPPWRKQPPTTDEIAAMPLWLWRCGGPPPLGASFIHCEVRDDCTGFVDAEGEFVAFADMPSCDQYAPCILPTIDGIRTAALALPVDDRNALRMALAESLPIPRCFDTSPALMAKAAQTMTAAEVEELIGLLTNRRPS